MIDPDRHVEIAYIYPNKRIARQREHLAAHDALLNLLYLVFEIRSSLTVHSWRVGERLASHPGRGRPMQKSPDAVARVSDGTSRKTLYIELELNEKSRDRSRKALKAYRTFIRQGLLAEPSQVLWITRTNQHRQTLRALGRELKLPDSIRFCLLDEIVHDPETATYFTADAKR